MVPVMSEGQVSTLSAALTAAQAKAIAALEKAYVAGGLEADDLRGKLDEIGARDTVDQERLIACLDVLHDYGAQPPAPPAETSGGRGELPITMSQRKLIERLMDERSFVAPADLATWNRDKASEVISQLQAGTYTDDVPF